MEYDFVKNLFNNPTQPNRGTEKDVSEAAEMAMELRHDIGVAGLRVSALAETKKVPPKLLLAGFIATLNTCAREMEDLLFNQYMPGLTDEQKRAALTRLQQNHNKLIE